MILVLVGSILICLGENELRRHKLMLGLYIKSAILGKPDQLQS